MLAVRIVLTVAAFAFAALVAYAMAEGGGAEALAFLTGTPWGWVTGADLYLGFALISVVIAIVEPNKGLAAALILATFVLGNLVPALWLAARLPRLSRASL